MGIIGSGFGFIDAGGGLKDSYKGLNSFELTLFVSAVTPNEWMF